MSLSKVLACLLLSLLVLHQLVEAADATQEESSESVESSAAKKVDCGAACAARCQLASRQKICKRACGTCCTRCNCVPPGTAGNRDVCPCYASMTTHGGRLKCP
ncbi:snakin-2-like isoform X1 [Rhodamnia argentea]|uniref:Snakin-2-like isoform X1 n=1 Tax=Rhodamnia argentea TaxID=178133 RepID=A0A8B8NYB1_9MYRT|nr:snakin-2-like isoform X1 [Rhodamnia argentea]